MTAEFSWMVRVYYEDTDTGGVVYYANYLKFFERARTEWLRGCGISQHELAHSANRLFVVTRSSISHHAPARLDDELRLTLTVERVRGASVQFFQQAWRMGTANEPQLLATAQIKVACVEGGSFRPAPIPPAALRAIRATVSARS